MSVSCTLNGNVSELRVYSKVDQGKRIYMEDELKIEVESSLENKAFIGVFDGHGGGEASVYARDNLFRCMREQEGFYDDDPITVKAAIRRAFIKTHWEMFKEVENWPKRKDGHNSTSGTTATVAVIRGNKLYIAHVGDSAAVLAIKENGRICSHELTVDHKPDNNRERLRIEGLGGKVSFHGIPRVVWKRKNQIANREEYVPFLAVARALGDIWSYDSEKGEFMVSPEPDIECVDLVQGCHKFLILASDGLWGVMNSSQAVLNVCSFEQKKKNLQKKDCASELVKESLHLWRKKHSRADNISAVVLFFDNDDFTDCSFGFDTDTDEFTPPALDSSIPPVLVRTLALTPAENFTFLKPSVKRKFDEVRGAAAAENGGKQHKLQKCSRRVRTIVSPQTLNELQLDDGIFADDESDVVDDVNDDVKRACVQPAH